MDRFRKNSIFENRRHFYRKYDQEGERCEDEKPGAEQPKNI